MTIEILRKKISNYEKAIEQSKNINDSDSGPKTSTTKNACYYEVWDEPNDNNKDADRQIFFDIQNERRGIDLT
jgi:hypothetical protein